MLLNKHIISILSLVLWLTTGYSQVHNGVVHCGSNTVDSIHSCQDPNYQNKKAAFEQKITAAIAKNKSQKTAIGATEIITIPVVVHVIHDDILNVPGGPFNSNISEAQIQSQIDVLNVDFRRLNEDTVNTPAIFKPVAADTYIEFCLATRDPDGNATNGITRTYTTHGTWDISEHDEMANMISWPSTDYLNIWVCQLGGGLLGFAQPPDDSGLDGLIGFNGSAITDGIVMHHANFGNRIGTATGADVYTYGRSATHEVGHWLGLLHTWGSFGCSGTDYVDDTPSTHYENYDCPVGQTSCTSQDMVENYMDYTDDQCMNIFTIGQRDRMRAVFDVSPRRKAILSSLGCCGSVVNYKLPFEESFEVPGWMGYGYWDTINVAGTTTWSNDNFGSQNTEYSAAIHNNPGNTGSISYMTLPVIDFTNTPTPIMEFDLAYSALGGSTTDSIVFSYETNCSETWSTLFTLTGADLITSTRNMQPLLPNGFDWKTLSFTLPELSGYPVVKIRIENYSNGINSVYFDNFNIYKSSDNLEVFLYPNPAYDDLYLDVVFDGVQDIGIEVYTLLGQEVLSENRIDTKSRLLNFDTSSLTNGIYIARITVGDDIVSKKFVIKNP